MFTSEFRYNLFKTIARRGYSDIKRFLQDSSNWGVEQIYDYQNRRLQEIVGFCYRYIPFYREMFDNIGLEPWEIKDTSDLQKLPILTKETIVNNYDKFYPIGLNIPYRNCATGGSTGVPLKYRLSNESAIYASLLLDRGLGFAGYKPGDRLAIIAGGSIVGRNITLRKHMIEKALNYKYFSSYGMDESLMGYYSGQLIKFQPKYLRGYASSLSAIARHMQANNVANKIHVEAVFSTSEVLTMKTRNFIEDVFCCKVYDGWGLNDGGASAFECEFHKGMHIDFERCYIEIAPNHSEVNDMGGKIIVTSLIEKSMPLIRYDTGDLGALDAQMCACGCNRPRLNLMAGRITDYLKVNNKVIGAPVLTVLMGPVHANQYQIAKTSDNALTIRIVKGKDFSVDDEIYIRKSLLEKLGRIDVQFEYHSAPLQNRGEKHRFIIDETDLI